MLKRLSFFAYALTCYLIFLGTFLYAIAFVGGFIVPRRLDGPLERSVGGALAIDCGLLAIFAVQHSIMARKWFKERWTQIVPWAIERSTFVLCASLALLLLFWQWRPIGIQVWSVQNGAVRAVLWTLFATGWGTVLVMTFLINHFDLFGLWQAWLSLMGKAYMRVEFRTPLPYRVVRHRSAPDDRNRWLVYWTHCRARTRGPRCNPISSPPFRTNSALRSPRSFNSRNCSNWLPGSHSLTDQAQFRLPHNRRAHPVSPGPLRLVERAIGIV